MTGGTRAGTVRRMHLAVQLPGEGERALPPDFDAYVRLARTAERGLFDFLLLAERPPPADCRTGQAPPATGPEPLTVLNALAAVTDLIGLAAAVRPGGREPYALARRIAALDRLSAGRAAGPASAVPELTVPRGPQGRPVVIGDGDDAAAEVAVVTGAVRRARPGTRVLARVGYVLAEEPGEPGAARAAGPPPPAGPFADLFAGPLLGPPRALADRLDAHVQSGAVDGYVLLPEPAPGGRGLDAFVDRVVPLLQERGSLRTAYRGTTLREHLGLPRPVWKA